MSSKYVQTKGTFSKLNLDKLVNPWMESILIMLGDATRDEMLESLDDSGMNDDQGILRKSITWRTKNSNGIIGEPKHMIDAPSHFNTVDIGSAAPHAWFVEHGTSPHSSPVGQDDFLRAIQDWCTRHGIDWDGEDAGLYIHILKKIRAEGTQAHPFVAPTSMKMKMIARREGIRGINKFILKLGKV